MSASRPARIKLPAKNGEVFDVSIHPHETVDHFISKVEKSADEIVYLDFKTIDGEKIDKEEMLMRQIIKKKFRMVVNDQKFTVYPTLESMCDETSNRSQSFFKDSIKDISVPVSRRIVIKHFIDSFYEQN